MREETRHAARGRLKIFFGAAAGVGTTYAMLQAARVKRYEGIDVVAGYIEPHKRPDITALVEGFEVLPSTRVEHGSAQRSEFDLHGALRRKPALILVDELAHSNPADFTHPKRWQDIDDLLNAGIDVYTTLNVQHLESASDIVTQITGAPVRETIPDRFVELADEVVLIDLPPEDLLQRLREGKVYGLAQAGVALENFFRKGNLMALRALALRSIADLTAAQVSHYRVAQAIETPWPVHERVLVCVTPGRLGERLVRTANRAALRLKADWIALYIETPETLRAPASDREQTLRTMRVAEQLGAETVTITTGTTFAAEIIELARARNVTSIVLGKPRRHGWKHWLFGSVVDAIIAGSGSIDVHVVSDEGISERRHAVEHQESSSVLPIDIEATDAKLPRWRRYLPGVLITTVCTVVAAIMSMWFAPTNLAMVYLLGVVLAATRFGRDASVVAAVLGTLAFDFFFIPPLYSFAISDTQYLLTAIVLLTVGLVLSSLAAGLRRQTRMAIHRERRTAALYAMTRELAVASSLDEIATSASSHLAQVFDAEGAILLRSADGKMRRLGAKVPDLPLLTESSIADWVFTQNKAAGFGTNTLPAANAMYLPLSGTLGIVGVLVVHFKNRRSLLPPEQRHLLATFANQIAVAVERDQLWRQARDAAFTAQEERLRNSLLSSISHDLRTPLAVIGGSASSLLQGETQLPTGVQRDIVDTINDEAQRMTRVVNNILDMTRLESGPVQLDLQWYPLEEILGAVLGRLKDQLGQRPVSIDIPRDLPMLRVDGVLFEKLLINLLENAAKYTPPGTQIGVSAAPEGGNILIRVIDDGPGIPKGSEKQLFDKFYRGQAEGAISGTGLGLSICRAIVEAHGGRIWAEARREGGAIFAFALPLVAAPDQSWVAHTT